MTKDIVKSPSTNKFTDKAFIGFLRVFFKDLIFRSVPITRNPPEKLNLATAAKGKKGDVTYYRLILELTEENVFITKSESSEWEPDTRYATALSNGPTINNQTMDRLRCVFLENNGKHKRDPTVARKKDEIDETITHMDLIMGLTCCLRLYGKLFTLENLKRYFPEGFWEEMSNTTKKSNPILIDRMSILGILWAITHMRRPFTFDSVSKSVFKEYFESASLIEAQNLIYILALGKRLQLITNDKIEKSIENLASDELLNSLSISDWIVALCCLDNDQCKIVPKLMNLIVEEIDGMGINYCIVYLAALININASPRKYQISYRKVLSRIEKIFSNIPIDSNMSYIFHMLCQLSCDMKGFFESICTKVIRIMHLMPLMDMVKLMCAIAIYGRNCEKSVKDQEDPSRIQAFINLENYIINKIKNNPPFPKELLNMIHDSIIGSSKFSNFETFCELLNQTGSSSQFEKCPAKANKGSKDIFKSKSTIELLNETFKLSSEERVFCANILEDCCTNIKKLDSDAIMQLVYSLLVFKVDMAPLGLAVKRLVDESVIQEVENEEMGFSVNLTNGLGDVAMQYKIAESIISYAQRGKQIKDKIDFKDTKEQLRSAMPGNESSSRISEEETPISTVTEDRECVEDSKESTISESSGESQNESVETPTSQGIEERQEEETLDENVGVNPADPPTTVTNSDRSSQLTRKNLYTHDVRRRREKKLLQSKLLAYKKNINPVLTREDRVRPITPVGVNPSLLLEGNVGVPPPAVDTKKVMARHPQYSTGPNGAGDRPISLYPQFTSAAQNQHVQQRLQMNQLLLQRKLRLQEQLNMINQRLEPHVQECNPVYPNYQGYYGNTLNNPPNNTLLGMNRKNKQGNKFPVDNKENYQMPIAPEPMSSPNFIGEDVVSPHMSNPYHSVYPDCQVYDPRHFVESPRVNPQLIRQNQNNSRPQYSNDSYPKPSTIADLKNQIRLIELEIERERLKELERNMTYLNN